MKYTIPHRLTRLNEYIGVERSNKYAAAKVKKDQTYLCSLYTPKTPLEYPVKITYIWTIKTMANDLGNVALGQKFIEDAMQDVGLIRNDNCTVIKEFTHKFLKGKNEQVEVIIEKWEDKNASKNICR